MDGKQGPTYKVAHRNGGIFLSANVREKSRRNAEKRVEKRADRATFEAMFYRDYACASDAGYHAGPFRQQRRPG